MGSWTKKLLILKPICQNDRLWNGPPNDVIVWLNPASAEDYQRLLPHSTLPVKSCPQVRERRTCRSTQKPKDKDAQNTARPVPSYGRNSIYIAFLLIPMIGKIELTIQKELGSLFTSFYRRFVCKQDTIRCRTFKKDWNKRWCYIDPTVMSHTTHKCEYIFITWLLLLCLLNKSFDMFWVFVFLTEITAASICEGRRLSNIHNC